ncbi:hypothetical protein [Mycolicibacterium thermoresistibile]
MAEIRYDGSDLVVELSTGEKIAALHGDVRVPRAAVRTIDVVDDALGAVRGVRAPGLGLPGCAKIGTWRRRDGHTFAVARAGRPGVRIRLDGQRYAELVISVPDAERVAATLG